MADLDILNLMQQYGLTQSSVGNVMDNIQDKLQHIQSEAENTDLNGKRMKEFPKSIQS